MQKLNLAVDYLKGFKIFDERVLAYLEEKYGTRKISLITADETMGITITVSELRDLNHALKQTIIIYPNKEFILTDSSIPEQYFNPDDEFVLTYLYLSNYWTNNKELSNPIFKKAKVGENSY